MKKITTNIILLFLFVIGINFSYGQVTIASNSFETSGDTWTPLTFSVPPCTNGADRWDYSTSLNSISASDGSQFWGIQDLNGNCGGTGYETITHPSINVSAYTNVVISFEYFTKGYDGPDYLGYEIWEDGTKIVDLVNLNKNSNSWVTVSYNVTITATNVYIVLKAKQNGGSDYAAFDNVKITGIAAATNDIDTEVYGLPQPAGVSISSATNTDSGNTIDVFKMTIDDQASGDGLPTKVTNIRIKPFTSNTAGWMNTIQGIVIDDGVDFLAPTGINITDAFIDITLANTDLVVADGGTKDITIAVYLKTSGIVDNSVLSFMVEAANHGFTADSSGSDFTSSFLLGDFNSNDFNVVVEATELQFTQQPTDVDEDTVMTPAVTVAYTDANGNVDVDYDGLGATATLSALGTTTFAATTTTDGTPVNGIMTFSDIEFVNSATGVTLTVTDNAGITTPSVTSNAFDVFLVINTDTEVYGIPQPTGISISSATNTDLNNAIDVIKMTIDDQASGDGLPTKVTNIRIKPHTSNTVGWMNTIQGIVIDDGVDFLAPTGINITDAFIDITLANTDLVVADGGTKDITIAVFLKTSGIVDNSILSFMVDAANHGFTADSSGSDFASSFLLGDFNSNDFTVSVEATELQFTQQPTDVEENAIMTPDVTVTYTDANGNVDVDYDGLGVTATLSASGATTFAATTTTDGTPVNGIMTFNDIEFTSPATGVTLTVTDSAGITTPSVTSNAFDVTAAPVGCSELFISEYVEGSSNNKYLEIFNSTAATIDLANYDIAIYSNASTSPNIIISFTSGATIASNSVYVLEHSLATVWTGTANQIVTNLNFNGNDVIALRKTNTNIDVIGTIGSSANFGKDTTLRRKNVVAFTNTTYTVSEWDSFASNTVADLAMHTSNCPCTGSTIYSSGNWDNGVPNETTEAIFISSYDTSVASIDACKCQVDSGATLTIAANSYLKVLESITNNGTIIVQNQGSVVQTSNDAAVTGTGTYNTEITTTNLVDENRFTYFSSPVVNATLNTFNPWADMLHMWDFTGATQYWHNVTDVNTVMTPARGYGIQPANGSTNVTPTTTFVGFFNNGIKSHAMFFDVVNAPDPMDNSSALVGNPYPSAINSSLLFQNNPQLGGIYIWNHQSALGTNYGDWENNDYIVCAANNNCTDAPSGGTNAAHSGFIASGQGFFVTANVASPNDLVFNNSIRVTDNNTDFRRNANNTEKLWLNLTSTIGYFNQSLFIFSPNGTPNYDNQADAKRLGSNFGIAIYSLASGTNERLAVDDSGEFQDNITIPLGYYSNNNNVSNLTLSIDHFENLENVNVYLKDNLLNITHDLKISDYVFATSTGIYDTRFEITFSKSTLHTNEDIITDSNNLAISTNDNQMNIQVLNDKKITNFKIFDVLGKLLVEVNPSASNFTLDTKINKATILFGKATLENGQVLTRKFIK